MAPAPLAQPVEIDDVQGIILRGYGELKSSCYLALQIDSVAGARAWLRDIAGEVTSAVHPVMDRHLNIAFSYPALDLLELSPRALAGFRSAFVEGVAGGHRRAGDGGSLSHRNIALGDVGASAPENWVWGNEPNPIHIALLLFAREGSVEVFTEHHRQRLEKHGLAVVAEFPTCELPGRKEHFGFRDGISQPALRNANPPGRHPGVLREDRLENTVEPGDFLFGYRNQYGSLAGGTGGVHLDFVRNGSFLVWRQLRQHVQEFWRAVRALADDDPIARRKLSAKFFGRWPSGAPLALAPEIEDPSLEDRNDFLYAADDPHGYRTPFGAHIRRGNPRDWHLAPRPNRALQVANAHRIIRRGRPYGPPVAASMCPEDILAAGPDETERGLHFLGFVADIDRQFEVIQGAWLNDPKFGGLDDEVDPVLGSAPAIEDRAGSFTIQATPLRRRLGQLSRFVTVRGGAYLFMPGLRAVRVLGSLRD